MLAMFDTQHGRKDHEDWRHPTQSEHNGGRKDKRHWLAKHYRYLQIKSDSFTAENTWLTRAEGDTNTNAEN